MKQPTPFKYKNDKKCPKCEHVGYLRDTAEGEFCGWCGGVTAAKKAPAKKAPAKKPAAKAE